MARRRDVTDIEILLLIERVDKMSQATDDLTAAVADLAIAVTSAVTEINKLVEAATAPSADTPVLTDLAMRITAQTAALTAALNTIPASA